MDAQYHPFGSVFTEQTSVNLQKGLKNIVVYIMFTVLLLLLFILLLITGVKCCYFLSTAPEPWSSAETQCQTRRGHLLVINNVEELDYISEAVDLRENYWIGLVERHTEGHWSWVDGSDYNSTQTFWDKGQPDDWDYRENGEDCGQLHSSIRRKRKLWNDADCGLAYRYICESNM